MGTSPRVASVASRAIWGDFESEGETNVEPAVEPVLQKSNPESDESSNLGNNGTIHGLSSDKLSEDASQTRSAAKSHIVNTEGCHNSVSDLSNSSSATVSTEPVNIFGQDTTDALPLCAISEFPSQNDPQRSCEHELSSAKSHSTFSELDGVGLCEDKKSLIALESDKLLTKQEPAAGIQAKVPEENECHTEKSVNEANLEEVRQENISIEIFPKDPPAHENCGPRDEINEKNYVEAASKKDEQPQDIVNSPKNLDDLEIPTEDCPATSIILDENYSAEHLSGDDIIIETLGEKKSPETTHTAKEELSIIAPKDDSTIKDGLTTDKSVIKITTGDGDDQQEPRHDNAFEELCVEVDGQTKDGTANGDVIAETTLKDASPETSIEGTLFKDPFSTKKGTSPGDSTEKRHPVGDDSRDLIPIIEGSMTEGIIKDATTEMITQFSSTKQLRAVETDLTSECKRVEGSLMSDSTSELKSADENTLPPSNYSSAPQTLNDEKLRGEASSERNSGKADGSNYEAASPQTNRRNNPKRTDSKGAESMTRQKGNPQQTPLKTLDLSDTTPPRGKHRSSRSGSSTPEKWKRSLREKIKDKIGDRLHKYKD